jgi:serine protease AprX
MKIFNFLFLLLFCFGLKSSAQFSKYVVQFKDKAGTNFSINNPSQFLSAKSIERRNKQQISIDETDLPIPSRYIDSVRLAGNVIILNQSKWLNQVCIETGDEAAILKINKLPFVKHLQPVMRVSNQQLISKNKFTEEINKIVSPQSPMSPSDYYSYGNSFGQINIHEGEYLHNKGFHGEGMLMAIIDAGFYHYQTLPAFDSVRINNQIADTYDFVANKVNVNEESSHGMQCFSIIAGNIPGKLVGSSPKAKFYLYRSEDASSESPVEEQNWIAAAERADSIGIDVISTSLGYSTFDNPIFNYSYQDMNGKTTMIAKAASLAAKKGMILLVAAGNEGANSWHYILSPGDADSVITVGAVNSSGAPASFTSYGPSSDGRVKPTVASVGVATVISSPNGTIVTGNGTSFATPNLAGLVTCLWQAFPDFTNMEIIEAVKKSSSIYNFPDTRIGYGIPNFRIAFEDLNEKRILKNITLILANERIKIYPNPAKNNFTVVINPKNTAVTVFRLYDAGGKLYYSKTASLVAEQPQSILFKDMPVLQKGIYFLKADNGKYKRTVKVVVQ